MNISTSALTLFLLAVDPASAADADTVKEDNRTLRGSAAGVASRSLELFAEASNSDAVIKSLLSINDATQQIQRCSGSSIGGTNTISVLDQSDTSGTINLNYDVQNYCIRGRMNQMSYRGTSPVTGQVTLDYSWRYCHAFFQSKLAGVYVEDATTTEFIPLKNTRGCGTRAGSITLNLEEGKEWGITLKSGHYDRRKVNKGNFKFALTQEPPVLLVPEDPLVVLSTTCSDAEAHDYSGSILAKDQDDNTLVAVCSPPPGSNFPIGTTTVTCAATDANQLTTTKSFEVEVISPAQQAWNLADGLPDTEKERLGKSMMNMAGKVVERLDNACPSQKACGAIGALENFLSAQIEYLDEVHDVDVAIIDTLEGVKAAAECTAIRMPHLGVEV